LAIPLIELLVEPDVPGVPPKGLVDTPPNEPVEVPAAAFAALPFALPGFIDLAFFKASGTTEVMETSLL